MANRKNRQDGPAPSAGHAHPERDIALERLVFFSDAVFAIAITLLALEIRSPADPSTHLPLDVDDQGLVRALMHMWPRIAAYGLSFAVVGIFWIDHHRKFRHVVRQDIRLLFLNLALMLGIAMIPFPTAVLVDYQGWPAGVLYAAWMTLVSALSAALWMYVCGPAGLLAPKIDIRVIRQERAISLMIPTIFLISVPVAYLDLHWARWLWRLTLAVSVVLMWLRGGTVKHAEPAP